MKEKEIKQICIKRVERSLLPADCFYENGCFIAELNPRQKSIESEYPLRICNFFVAIIREGEGRIGINQNEYRLSGPALLINTPNNIITTQPDGATDSYSGCLISFDEEFLQSISIDTQRLLPLFLAIRSEPLFSIPLEECDELIRIVREIKAELTPEQRGEFFREILQSYFAILLYRIGEIIQKRRGRTFTESQSPSVKSRNKEYFESFMKHLAENFREERSLGFYASKLCITPKYLTTIIKRESGRSASEWIDLCVIQEAKNLLRYSSLSIQEISFRLNFPNQSFFGKYFKHHTGYSPTAYKMAK